MFNKFFGKMFDRPLKKTYQAIVKNTPGFENIGNIEFTRGFEKLRGRAKDAFGGVTSLVAATIIGKRVIVPFIATPLAGVVEKMMAKHDAKKKGLNFEGNKPNEIQNVNATNSDANKPSEQKKVSDTNLLNKYKK